MRETTNGPGEPTSTPLGDWRDFRAKLIAQEKTGEAVSGESTSWAYETPLVETGVVILGGTEGFGFALNQQYFHKSVMLVLSHDKSFTKGVILNRPTSVRLATADSDDEFDVWFGGDVQGLFEDDESRREINCLHALPMDDETSESSMIKRLSFPIVRGISYTSLDGAQELVRLGLAEVQDFWVFIGYAGWGPEQLQGELDRQSWHLAAADSENLLRGMLKRDATSQEDVGMSTWASLMARIGREVPIDGEGVKFDDDMLREWARVNLGADCEEEKDTLSNSDANSAGNNETQDAIVHVEEEKGDTDTTSPFPECEQVKPGERKRRNSKALFLKDLTGCVLRSGVPSQYILQQQYLHRGIVLILADKSEMAIGVVVNRISSSVAQFRSTGQKRRINLGGEQQIGSISMLVFHANPDLAVAGKSQKVGDSGLYQISITDADALMKKSASDSQNGESSEPMYSCDDFLFISGVKVWGKGELKKAIKTGALELVPNPSTNVPWQEIVALGRDPSSSDSERLDGGTAVWEKLFALSNPSPLSAKSKREELADRALEKFAEVFLSDEGDA